MSCVKKKTDALCAITLKITLVAFLISSLPEIAQAAMPVLNANPFTQAQNALKTLIENAVTLGKWLAMACMVVCFLASLTDRFKKETCIRLAIIMAAFSGLGWIVELFMGAM